MKTIKLRIKDKHVTVLNKMAREVNFVWNYVNELCSKHLIKTGEFLSAYDVDKYTQGASKLCLLHSDTIQGISAEINIRRKQFKKTKLKWRVSNTKSARRSLGWVPFKERSIQYSNGWIQYKKRKFHVWDSYDLSKYNVKCGSFVEDARGRWYVCLVVDNAPALRSTGNKAIGIDLGLKNVATCSDGTKIENPKFYKKYERKLAIAQRAKNKKRVRALHAKIKNCRADHLQKESTRLVKENALIVIGNVSASKLAKTKMAKSVMDASFAAFKTMLRYKCEDAGVLFEEVNESYTTLTCSYCSGDTGPRGFAGLGIREWECRDCGTVHDRDINSALNILALGHQRLAGGITIQ